MEKERVGYHLLNNVERKSTIIIYSGFHVDM
jgi:hypothetical protein